MPFKIISEQSAYRFTLDALAPGGLPVADVMQIGGISYMVCCPLCGMIHETRAGDGDEFTPNCIARVTHKMAYAAWRSAHLEAAGYTSVRLRYRAANITPLADAPKPARPVKRTRRKAA